MANRYSSSKLESWRISIHRRINDIKASTLEISKTLEILVQELNNFETVCVEENSNRHSNEENEGDDAPAGDTNEDNGNSSTGTYFCPNVECRERKADTSLKQYVRHYDTHVECLVRCPSCHSVSHNVASLKRHPYVCQKLKSNRNNPAFAEKLQEMETRRKEESRRASTEAQTALILQKRRQEPEVNTLRSRKKAKLQKRLNIPTLILEESPPNHAADSSRPSLVSSPVINNEPNGYNYNNAADQHIAVHNSPTLASPPSQSLAYPTAVQDTSHNAATVIAGLEFINPTINKLAMHHTENQYPTIKDNAAVVEVPNARDKLIDGSAIYTNDQVSMIQPIATILRPLGFESHTMDGSGIYLDNQYPTAQSPVMTLSGSSIYYPDKQYSTTHDAATATRPLGFESHTMDGSSIFQALQFWDPTGDA
ncbi:hypothetical protein F4802DRAFT_270847 [Xylaria palmicola]|nr:hypothetical protein F4802DRAFT_270847 [Xylaria palmicola]